MGSGATRVSDAAGLQDEAAEITLESESTPFRYESRNIHPSKVLITRRLVAKEGKWNEYCTIRTLGTGSTGTVMLVENWVDGQRYALKQSPRPKGQSLSNE
eukprot:Sspe_Gene.22364::Locus_8492_Transcript_1_1_Confidence_1.000_Length_378::g.22364::m.22364